MKRLAIAVSLLLALPVLAQEMEARNVAWAPDEHVGALSCTYEIWAGDAPLAVDAEGNPVSVSQYVSYALIRSYVAGGDTLAQATLKAVTDTINTKLMAEATRLEPVEIAPEGMAVAADMTVAMDRDLRAKRIMVRELQGKIVAAPDCELAQTLLTEGTAMLGSNHGAVTRAGTAYVERCGE